MHREEESNDPRHRESLLVFQVQDVWFRVQGFGFRVWGIESGQKM